MSKIKLAIFGIAFYFFTLHYNTKLKLYFYEYIPPDIRMFIIVLGAAYFIKLVFNGEDDGLI